jgi:hypothetical protein
VAPGHHWRGPGWRRSASSVRRTRKKHGLGAYEHRWYPIANRGGGHPKQAMVLTPVSRMGPLPRSFAADAHGCIMVRCPYGPTGYKVAARVPRAPTASSPRTRHPDHNEQAAVLGSLKARPGNDGACGQHRATAGLDSPCARRLPTRVGRGEETGFHVEQRNWNEGSGECREIVLDFESLIQGLLGLHTRYGREHRSAVQDGLCHEAPAQPVTQRRSPATGPIDNYPGGIFLHW